MPAPTSETPRASIRAPFIATRDEVMALREERGCSMFAARRLIVRRKLLEATQAAESVAELRAVIAAMLVMPELFMTSEG